MMKRIYLKIELLTWKQSKSAGKRKNGRVQHAVDCSLAEKNRDLNQAREKLEQMETIRRNLTEDLAALRTSLKERENEIARYELFHSPQPCLLISRISLREECERIQFDSEQEIQKTKLQVQEIIVRTNGDDCLNIRDVPLNLRFLP